MTIVLQTAGNYAAAVLHWLMILQFAWWGEVRQLQAVSALYCLFRFSYSNLELDERVAMLFV